jgi:hypothetical protein
MFETEGDTLALTFKSEHGNYSDGFRKAFHHETISYNRRKDREFVEINNPRLSALLSGTPKPIRSCLTSVQQKAFNAYFAQTQNQYLCLYGGDYLATVRRLGLITFRMAMILTALRIMDNGNISSPLVCRDNDFNTALSMVKILVQHAAQVFQQLPSDAVATAPRIKSNSS